VFLALAAAGAVLYAQKLAKKKRRARIKKSIGSGN